MKRILVITNRFKDTDNKTTQRVCDFLASMDVDVTQIGVDRKVSILGAWIPEGVELAIILGGDGTIMQFASELSEHDIPILGINMGHLGYLAEVESSNVELALKKVLDGEYTIQERMMLKGIVHNKKGETVENYALNDVVITRSGKMQIMSFNIYINSNLLKSYSADGMILSTPTGSTAYNLSAGGPIVDPGAELLLFTPICPHTLMNRSIVLKADDNVEIEMLATHEDESDEILEANYDGNVTVRLSAGDRVSVSKADRIVRLVRLGGISFLDTLHRKLKES